MLKLNMKKIGVALAGLGLVMASQAAANDYRVLVSGRLQADGAHFWEDEESVNNDAEASRASFDRSMIIRRADLFVKGHLPHHWQYRVGFNLANIAKLGDATEFDVACADSDANCISDRAHAADRERMLNAWIGYNGFENLFVAFGRVHVPHGLDDSTSDSWTTFMERASVADAFAPHPGVGAYLEGLILGGDLGFAVALVTPDQGDRYPNHRNDNLVYGGRVHYAPFNDHGNVVHLGVSAWRHNMIKNTETFGRVVGFPGVRVRQTPPIIGTTFRAANTADYVTTWNVEAGGVMGPFFGKAEYSRLHVDGKNGTRDLEVYGYTAEVSYVLTGESRRYDRANGVFGGVNPDSSKGAIELAVRFTRLDLTDRGNSEALVNKPVFPGQPGDLKNWTVGANWYATKNVKFSVNYIHSHANYVSRMKSATIPPAQKGSRRLNTIAARGQVVFG